MTSHTKSGFSMKPQNVNVQDVNIVHNTPLGKATLSPVSYYKDTMMPLMTNSCHSG